VGVSKFIGDIIKKSRHGGIFLFYFLQVKIKLPKFQKGKAYFTVQRLAPIEPKIALVEELRATGVWVRLPNQIRAWLPASELYADYHPHQDLRQRGSALVGTKLLVVELANGENGFREIRVSHVRATNDPWANVKEWRNGEVKVMEVTLVTPKRALGIIPPGIRAAVSLQNWPSQFTDRWLKFAVPLPGDEVAGYFFHDQVNENERLVSLDFMGYVRKRVQVPDALLPLLPHPINTVVPAEVMGDGWSRSPTQTLDFRGIESVLLVDDDPAILSLAKILLGDFEVCLFGPTRCHRSYPR
jgi:hypothetical protein